MQAVLDRFSQVEPTVLLAVDGYRYGRHDVSRVEELVAIRAGLPTLGGTVMVPYLDSGSALPEDDKSSGRRSARRARHRSSSSRWHPSIRCTCCTRRARPVLPKPILHGHGGVLLEHLQGARIARRHGRRRPILLVQHHRLDDVEPARVRPAGRCRTGAVRRRPQPRRSRNALATRRRRTDHLVRWGSAVLHRLPPGRHHTR